MFTQPTPVFSLRSDLWSRSLSSQPLPTPVGEQTNLSACWVLVGTNPLCGNLSSLLSALLLLHSPQWLWSFPRSPLSLPVKGLPSVWKIFLLHSSLPEVQVLSLFFFLCFLFFLLPYPGMWRVSCLLGSLRSSASVQYVFCRSCSTCRYIFDVFVGRKFIFTSYSSAILKVLFSNTFILLSFFILCCSLFHFWSWGFNPLISFLLILVIKLWILECLVSLCPVDTIYCIFLIVVFWKFCN